MEANREHGQRWTGIESHVRPREPSPTDLAERTLLETLWRLGGDLQVLEPFELGGDLQSSKRTVYGEIRVETRCWKAMR